MAVATCTLILEGTWPGCIGGITTWVQDLITSCPQVEFRVARIGPPVDHWFVPRPANVQQFVCIPDGATLTSAGVREWANKAAELVPTSDVVHAIGAGLAAALADAIHTKTDVPWVLCEHASYVAELALGQLVLETGRCVADDGPAAKRALVDTFEQIAKDAYQSAAICVALDGATSRWQRNHGAHPSKQRVIGNGVVPGIRRRRSSERHIVQVGRIAPIKGTLDFVAACGVVKQNVPALVCLHVGPIDDPFYMAQCQHLNKRLGSPVTFLGPRERGDFGTPSPDLLVLTSISEAQPLVILEAMARGIPVAATDVGDCRAMLEHPTRSGTVVPSKQPKHMASAIEAILADPAQWARWSDNAIEASRHTWSWQGVVRAYLDVYRDAQRSTMFQGGPN